MTLYNVDKVLERVSNLQPEESRLIFAEEIFDWTDNYTEKLLPNADTIEAKQALESIASLWIKYATMEQNLRQWKKAVQVYDDALNDSLASRSLSVYIAYAELCKLRGKISNAQKVYIKALTAGFLPQETDIIWRDFLKIMKDGGSPELTIDQLFAAVSSQVGNQSLTKPSSNFQEILPIETTSSSTTTTTNENNQSKIKVEGEPASKRIKTETEQININNSIVPNIPIVNNNNNNHNHNHVQNINSLNNMNTSNNLNIPNQMNNNNNNNSHMNNNINIPPNSIHLNNNLNLTNNNNNNINKINNNNPLESISTNIEQKKLNTDNSLLDSKSTTNQQTFKIQAPSTLLNLHEISTNSIDELLKLHSNRPTMLFRPLNAEDMKQVTLSGGAGFTNINKSLVNDVETYFSMKIPLLCEIDRNVPDSKISRVLDIIESLWISQGLSERYFDYWFSNLIQSQLKEESILKTKFFEDEKLLVGNTSNTANASTSLDILHSKQKIELRNFRIKNELQIQILNAYVNSVMENILQDQLIVVSLIDGFPHRILENVEGDDGEMQEKFALLKQVVNALLSIRLHTRTHSNISNKKKFNPNPNPNIIPNPLTEKKIQQGQSEWEDENDDSSKINTLEGARAAALAARKTTFKKKRRKIPDITSRYYTSHYGSTTVDGQSIPVERFRSPLFPGSNIEQESSHLPSNQNSTSNLHKLAALLGKAKK